MGLAWALWCIALAAALWWGCDLPWWWRLGLLGLVGIALWQGVRGFLRQGGRLRCDPGGQWQYEPAPGAVKTDASYVQPASPRLLGPLLWVRGQVLDSACVEPNAWRAIKARMKVRGPAGRDRSP